jgi:hypothetical protein
MVFKNASVEAITVYGNSEYVTGFSLGIQTNNNEEILEKLSVASDCVLRSDSGVFQGCLRKSELHPNALCHYAFTLVVDRLLRGSVEEVQRSIVSQIDASTLVLEIY